MICKCENSAQFHRHAWISISTTSLGFMFDMEQHCQKLTKAKPVFITQNYWLTTSTMSNFDKTSHFDVRRQIWLQILLFGLYFLEHLMSDLKFLCHRSVLPLKLYLKIFGLYLDKISEMYKMYRCGWLRKWKVMACWSKSGVENSPSQLFFSKLGCARHKWNTAALMQQNIFREIENCFAGCLPARHFTLVKQWAVSYFWQTWQLTP